jgi:uncharacterized protein YdeI (YjbR/CyaY-like superfamily)
MGTECHLLLILKSIREQIGKTFGDEVHITVEADDAPRVVAVPKDLAAALKKDRDAKALFDKLSYTHQKEYAAWIEEAKKDETRQRRIAKTLTMLKAGK